MTSSWGSSIEQTRNGFKRNWSSGCESLGWNCILIKHGWLSSDATQRNGEPNMAKGNLPLPRVRAHLCRKPKGVVSGSAHDRSKTDATKTPGNPQGAQTTVP